MSRQVTFLRNLRFGSSLARLVLCCWPMCGYGNANWLFSLSMLVLSSAILVAAVILVIRGAGRQQPKDRD
jgi:hypothetical protein